MSSNNSKKQALLRIILSLLLIATLCFIWSNSIKSPEKSSQQSSSVTEIVRPPLEFVVGKGNATENLVRKLAHFTEFAVLGAELLLMARLLKGVKFKDVLVCLFIAVLCAMTDETIQLYTSRGSMVTDVWLDSAGAAFGIFIAWLICCLKVKSKRRQR